MTNTELIQAIRKEIERLRGIGGNLPLDNREQKTGYESALIDVETFLDTLESEKPVPNDLDFEQELYKHFGQVKDFTLGMRIGQYFYELGCRRTAEKYDEIEYSRQRAEESVPNDLEEAAEDFVWEVMENDEDGISDLCRKLQYTSKISDFYDALAEFFIAGAKWQAEQLLKSSPLPEDTVLFNKGVEEGKRLMMEEMSECFAQLKQVQSESINMSAVREQLAYNRGASDERYKMRKKMMEEAVEGEYGYFSNASKTILPSGKLNLKDGDKVRIIILPKEN